VSVDPLTKRLRDRNTNRGGKTETRERETMRRRERGTNEADQKYATKSTNDLPEVMNE
jgi:hypothetical protein